MWSEDCVKLRRITAVISGVLTEIELCVLYALPLTNKFWEELMMPIFPSDSLFYILKNLIPVP